MENSSGSPAPFQRVRIVGSGLIGTSIGLALVAHGVEVDMRDIDPRAQLLARDLVKSLDLSAGGELSMILKGGTIVRFGPPTDLQRKLVAVVVLLRRQDPATLAVVDVSTGEPTVQTR